MIRPNWGSFIKNINSFVLCSCGTILQNIQITREHWQMGHFDYEDSENKTLLNNLSEEEKETLERLINAEPKRCKNCNHLFYFHYNSNRGAWGYHTGCRVTNCKCDNDNEYWRV